MIVYLFIINFISLIIDLPLLFNFSLLRTPELRYELITAYTLFSWSTLSFSVGKSQKINIDNYYEKKKKFNFILKKIFRLLHI